MSIEKYCIPVDILPLLSDESCAKIIEYSKKNIHLYNSYVNLNGKTIFKQGISHIGFSSMRMTDFNEGQEFAKSILEENGIYLIYEKVALVLQRSAKKLVPHTDPGRNVSLLFNIKGLAQTDFYEMDNFIPNIDYTNTQLSLQASIQMKLKNWYLFNNSAIHGVQNIPEYERLAFVINLGDTFKDFATAKNNLKSILK